MRRLLRGLVYHPRERNVNFYELELTVAKRGTRKWLLELWRPLLSSMCTFFRYSKPQGTNSLSIAELVELDDLLFEAGRLALNWPLSFAKSAHCYNGPAYDKTSSSSDEPGRRCFLKVIEIRLYCRLANFHRARGCLADRSGDSILDSMFFVL